MHDYNWRYVDGNEPVEGYDRYYPCKQIEYQVSFPEDTTWPTVIQEFARFLDSTGYVGVADAIDAFVNAHQLNRYHENEGVL